MNVRCRIALAIIAGLAAMIGAAVVLMAAAHQDGAMTYPPECCSGMDCAPVEKVEIAPSSSMATMLVPPAHASPSVMVVTTRHGTAAVPANIQHRQSQDHRLHACIRQGRVICIFLPPTM